MTVSESPAQTDSPEASLPPVAPAPLAKVPREIRRIATRRARVARWIDRSGLGWWLRRMPLWKGVLILNYHRIGHPQNSLFDHALWSATAEDFDEQMRHIAQEFTIISSQDLEHIQGRRNERFVMVTFDDGYLDNYEVAFPILRRHGLTATFFLTTGFLDQPSVPWWDEIAWMMHSTQRDVLTKSIWCQHNLYWDANNCEAVTKKLLRTFKSLQGPDTNEFLDYLADRLETGRCPRTLANNLWMTWDQVREMRRAGMSFGGHTTTHPVLANIPRLDQQREIAGSRERIEKELGEPIRIFSYPVGGQSSFNQLTLNSLEAQNFRWAFTYLGGTCPLPTPCQFELPRCAIELEVDLPMFRSMLAIPSLMD